MTMPLPQRLYISDRDLVLDDDLTLHTEFGPHKPSTVEGYVHRAALHDPAKDAELHARLGLACALTVMIQVIREQVHPEEGPYPALERVRAIPATPHGMSGEELVARIVRDALDEHMQPETRRMVRDWMEQCVVPELLDQAREHYPPLTGEHATSYDRKEALFEQNWQETARLIPEMCADFLQRKGTVLMAGDDRSTMNDLGEWIDAPSGQRGGLATHFAGKAPVLIAIRPDLSTVFEELGHLGLIGSPYSPFGPRGEAEDVCRQAIHDDLQALQAQGILEPLSRWYAEEDKRFVDYFEGDGLSSLERLIQTVQIQTNSWLAAARDGLNLDGDGKDTPYRHHFGSEEQLLLLEHQLLQLRFERWFTQDELDRLVTQLPSEHQEAFAGLDGHAMLKKLYPQSGRYCRMALRHLGEEHRELIATAQMDGVLQGTATSLGEQDGLAREG